MTESICEIPLYSCGVVVARTLVDEDDWFAFARYRWALNVNGYAIGTMGGGKGRQMVGGRRPAQLLHRLILGLEPGDKLHVDHINRDRLDNRRSNLRVISQSQNNQNVTPRKGVTSQYRGVHWHKTSGLWHARCTIAGENHSLGYYKDEHEAGEVAAEFRRLRMPDSPEALAERLVAS